MGRLLAPYGVKGWIKARPFTAAPDALLEYGGWWLSTDERHEVWREFRVLLARPHVDTVVAALDGLASREAAMAWRGAFVGVPRTSLPKPAAGEFYRDELAGFGVVNRSGKMLGRVSGFLETGAHPVLQVIAGDGSEKLIPWVPAYVDAIDAAAGRILVDWQLDY